MDVFAGVLNLHVRLRVGIRGNELFGNRHIRRRYVRQDLGGRNACPELPMIRFPQCAESVCVSYRKRNVLDRSGRRGRIRRVQGVLRNGDGRRRLDAHHDEPREHRMMGFERFGDRVEYAELRFVELFG